MSPWILGRIERLLDRQVRESVSASARLERLEGRALRITVVGLGVDVVLAVEQGAVRVRRASDAPVDAAVRGAPLDLLRLAAKGPGLAAHLHGSGVELTGRMHVAEEFAALLELARPDPEEELARWVGDLAAHRAGSAARAAGRWLADALESLRRDAAEYLTEESRALPTRFEAERLFRDVERLRDDVERTAARLESVAERLEQGAAAASGNPPARTEAG